LRRDPLRLAWVVWFGPVALAMAAMLSPAGCDEPTTNLRGAVELLGAEQGEVAERALATLKEHGTRRDALPYLEAALHRVPPKGRRNVVIALRQLALPEAAPLLGHLAAFDAEPTVRAEAYSTLELWAARGVGAAGSALRLADSARSAP